MNKIMASDFNPDFIQGYSEDTFLSDITETLGHHFHKWCQNLCRSKRIILGL